MVKKKWILVLAVLALSTSACTRTASEGELSLKIMNFTGQQPDRLFDRSDELATAQGPMLSAPLRTAAASSGSAATVCLAPGDSSAQSLGTTGNAGNCLQADGDGGVFFERQEGNQIAVVDLNGDGQTDAIAHDVAPGTQTLVSVTKLNTRPDGGYLVTKNDKVIYRPGDTATIRVFGWLPAPEAVHVEIWNNWNGGFHYFSSEPRTVSGDVDFRVQVLIPHDWPGTNQRTGAAYFSYPATSGDVYNGDNFVLLGKSDDEPASEGVAPANPLLILANGAEAVSSTTVTARVGADRAAFVRMANETSGLATTPWVPLENPDGADVTWTLQAGIDGSRTAYAQFADEFGTLSAIASDTLVLDATPIVISNLAAEAIRDASGGRIAITFQMSEEAVGGLTVQVAGAAAQVNCSTLDCTAIYPTTTEGSNLVIVRAIDRVGWATYAQHTAYYDFTPPDTSFSGPVPTGVVASKSATFNLVSSETSSTFACSLNGATFAACPVAVSLTGLPEGENNFRARAIDGAGNMDLTPSAATWIVNTLPPETQIDSGPSAWVNQTSVTLTFSSASADTVRFECSLNAAAYATCTSPRVLGNLSDGAYSIAVRAIDVGGNIDASPAMHSWQVDTTPPDTTITAAPMASPVGTEVSISFSSPSPDAASYSCSLNGAAFAACTSPRVLTGLADGSQTFSVRAVDTAGNTDPSPAITSWVTDAIPPDTQIGSGPTGRTSSTSASIGFSSPAADAASFQCQWNAGAWAVCTSPASQTGLAEGEQTFAVRAVDAVGNIDPTPATRTWTIDLTPPDTQITSAPATPTNAPSGSFSFTSPAADLARFECRLNAGTFTTCTSPHATGILTDGEHTMRIRAVDTTGNVDATPSEHVWRTDNTPPETIISSAPSGQIQSTSATIAFYTAATDLTGFDCQVDAGAFAACLSPFQVENLIDGLHTVRIRAADQLGNVENPPVEVTWTVDRQLPVTSLLSTPPSITSATTASISFTSSDTDISRFECSLDSGAWATCTSPANYSSLAEGNHTLTVRAVDLAGNIETSPPSAFWQIDLTAPDTLIGGGPQTVTNATTASIVFAAVGADVGGFDCRLDGGAYAPCTSPWSLSTLSTGAHAVYVRAYDAVGNVDQSPAGWNWTIDNVAPQTTIVSGPSGTVTSATANFIFSANKPGTFACSLNGALYTACPSTYEITGLGQGSHTLAVRAVDPYGNVDSTPAARTWTVDFLAPNTVILEAPTAVTRSTFARFVFEASETAAFQCMLDDGFGYGFANCTSPAFFSGLADGAHRFEVRAIDAAGNIDQTPAAADWIVDTTTPAITLLMATPRGTTATTITITFDVSELPDSLLVTVGGRAAMLASIVGTFHTFEYIIAGDEGEGPQVIVVEAADAAGNQASAQTTTLFDFTPPQTTLSDILPAAYTQDQNATFGFSSSEAGTFECSLNGAAFAPCTSPRILGPLPDGLYTFDVRAVDVVGLVDATPATHSWTVDNLAPPAPAPDKVHIGMNPPGTADTLHGDPAAIEGEARVNVYADAFLTISLGTRTVGADGSFVAFPIGDDVGDANQYVYVTALDRAGNESAATPVRNPRIKPRVTRALIGLVFSVDTNVNDIGNPGDELKLTWDNSVDGDNNQIITSVTAAFPAMGITGMSMVDDGNGFYTLDLPLVAGTFDGVVEATITVVGEAGLTMGPVRSRESQSVDVDLPLPPASLVGVIDGTQLLLDWTASPSTDTVHYFIAKGYTYASQVLYSQTPITGLSYASAVTPCSEVYFGIIAVDDAGNYSVPAEDGPLTVNIGTPEIKPWGAVLSLKAKILDAVQASAIELHFAPVTVAVGAPPWSNTDYGIASPVTVAPSGVHTVFPLKWGTDFLISARATKNTCQGPFSTPVQARTLSYLMADGDLAYCPGCTWYPGAGSWSTSTTGSTGAVYGGETHYGAVGFSVANIGDNVGADGIDDFFTAVPGETSSVVISGATLEMTATIAGYYGTLDIVGGGPNLASAGDVNGDGKQDLLIGSPTKGSGEISLHGMLRLVDGDTYATIFEYPGQFEGEQFGYAVSRLGDIFADGRKMVMAGGIGCLNYSCSTAASSPGTVHIFAPDGIVVRSHMGSVSGAFFGVSLHGGVDVTGSGRPDYVIGAPGHLGDTAPAGRVSVYDGETGLVIFEVSGNLQERFGASVRLVHGSRPGDTTPRLIVGAPSRISGTPGRVIVYTWSGSTFEEAYVLDGEIPEGSLNFGISLTSGGDLDGDGTYEIVVGDPNIPLSAQYGNGRAYGFDLETGLLVYELSGNLLDGALGYAMDFLGDQNADGVQELLAGAPGANIDGVFNAGKVYVISIKAP